MTSSKTKITGLLVMTLVATACGKGGKNKKQDGLAPTNPPAANLPQKKKDGNKTRETQSQPFVDAAKKPKSTFSIDVDTASYTLTRSYIDRGSLPPKQLIRAEEFINYFDYGYEPPKEKHPVAVHTETAAGISNETEGRRLVRIGLKAKELAKEERPPMNLVFLIDVSGSMAVETKLPLLKAALRLLVAELRPTDRVGIVTYSGRSRVALESTAGSNPEAILQAINGLRAGGSTNGRDGINTAYSMAGKHFKDEGMNRVVLCTDGDFNVGETNPKNLVQLIRSKAERDIFLTALGFGMHSNDRMLETLADKGDGHYAYIDSMREARKVFLRQIQGTLVTVAKDFKVQVQFKKKFVSSYRLVGYHNRRLQNDDFRDDQKDAGDIGAGHSVTAFYEVKPKQESLPKDKSFMTVRLRYKKPGSQKGIEFEKPVKDSGQSFEESSESFRFAASVAAFARRLQGNQTVGYQTIAEVARQSRGEDPYGDREEFIGLVNKASGLKGRRATGRRSFVPTYRYQRP